MLLLLLLLSFLAYLLLLSCFLGLYKERDEQEEYITELEEENITYKRDISFLHSEYTELKKDYNSILDALHKIYNTKKRK